MPELELFLRWVHFIAGTIWVGMLFFFTLVNTPYIKITKPEERPAHIPKLMPLALAWFRYASVVTVLVGLMLIYIKYWSVGDVVQSDSAKTILVGGILGIIMMLNVWLFIWPNQKRIIQATVKGEKPDPSWGKRALLFSRINFTLSYPMLLFMGASSHYPMGWGMILITGVITALIGLGIVLYVQR
ncbi:urate hydroxylase PuuD [Hydrogenobacter hydrogenophilus]|uniref:Urate oxidase N-terminal domain-containing protein n=1 Tax=Hydrogenobacter hydrogenophilus TaxID=35835 RepID=A0A285NX42_9AQUI|nr:urate hydroxylase PuuD [Hydrogenobacter hydrogenophilus]SNZ14062.1 Protein of unknown function [Hydrogenobacter hydrogenophilus]